MNETHERVLTIADHIRSEWEAAPFVTVREARPDDWQACGRICYEAFATLADEHGFEHDFPTVEAASEPIRWMISHPRFYGVVAEIDGQVVGSSFLDERGTILGIGPVSVDPCAQNHHVGHLLMEAMFDRARLHHAPGVRLLQLCYHNRSLSLYAKLGMDVRGTFAAMCGPAIELALPGYHVRRATDSDLSTCNDLCFAVHGHSRAGEVAEAIESGAGLVVERLGRITGYTTGVNYFAHAVAETRDDLIALIGAAGDYGTPGFLVPLADTELFRWCLAHGLRVFFVLNMLTVGLYQEPSGAYMPSVGY
ncbi:MAG TPA: GNAT family N-acetyltransferase [Candidatus Limnocylindrales bacterium]